jgi:hypothetical protein
MKKGLPISIQTFSELREKNYVYVDKTPLIYKIMNEGKMYFLSRPRRFGKSMTISTLEAIYEGRKELFEGLWIEDKWDWSRQYPVIHISFNNFNYKDNPLTDVLSWEMKAQADKHGIILQTNDYARQFEELIQKLAKAKGKVVILIDEYDKPIIDFLEKPKHKIAKNNRDILRQFYACLKSNDYNIEFFLMTGVSKFSQTGIFSHLNHLNDISLNDKFATLVGYTHEELVLNFKEYIEHAAQKIKYSEEELLKDIKMWYNGYSWDGVSTVYNPYSVLLFFANGSFQPHWYSTGSPKFLLDIIKNVKEYDFNQLKVQTEIIDSYEIEDLNIRTLLFQTGYLTVKERDIRNGTFLLDYPNREVEQAMSRQILALMTANKQIDTPLFNAHDAFLENDMERIMEILNSMLEDVPSPLYKKKEHFFHSLVHLFFRYMGFRVESEVNTVRGRLDAVVKTDTHIYIFEFKIRKTAQDAFQQILDKKYADKYRMFNKTIVGIGINFDADNKCIDEWKIENL